jgi:hypothetical protein
MLLRFSEWLEATESDKDYEEEKNFARRIIQREVTLEGFQYYEDYVKTVAQEARMISGKTLFIGSGPVPLTPIILKKNHGIDVDAMEYNQEAVQISQQLMEVLGVHINVILSDATTFRGYGSYQTIIISLEAGPNEGLKRAIFDNIKGQIKPSTSILIRGSNMGQGDEAFPNVEGYVQDYFEVVKKIPVFSNLSTTYLLHCRFCPTPKPQAKNKGIPSVTTPGASSRLPSSGGVSSTPAAAYGSSSGTTALGRP